MKKYFFLLIVIAALLGIGVILVQDPFGLFESKISGRRTVVENVDVNVWQEIEIASAADTVRIARESDGWKVKSLRDLPADRNAILNLLDQFRNVPEAETASRDASKHALFEVDEANGVKMKATGADGKTYFSVVVGKSDTMGTTYVREEGQDIVYRIAKPLRSYLRATSKEWLEKKIFQFNQFDIKSLSIEWGKDAFKAERKDSTHWDLIEPHAAPADADVLNVVASNFANLNFRELQPEGTELPGKPITNLTAVTQEGTVKTLVLAREGREGDFHGRIEGTDLVFTFTPISVEALRQPQDKLLEKRLLRNSPDDITAFTLESKSGVVSAKKKDDGSWEISAPEASPAKKETAQELCSTIANIKAETSVFDEKKKGLGFKNYRLKSTFELKDGTKAAFVWGSKKKGNIHLTREDMPLVFTVPESTFNSINKTLSDLKQQ